MLRALWWKEWRQLRLLRWSGAGIGILLPPFLLVTAEAGERGWTVFGGISNYDPATVVQEALPMVMAYAVWPLLALMTAAQVFTADRAGGTEEFLLQRPVRRSRIWRTRGGAALATTLVIVAAQVAIWWVCVRLLGNPAGFDESATLVRMLLLGVLGAVVALLAGAAAAAFVRSPMQAVLLGLVMTAVPVVIGQMLGWWFVGYRIRQVPLGYGIPLLLLVGYVVGSFRMECRGEPAGRGRLRRGLIAVGIALVAMPVFLAATAPAVMRWDAKLGLGNSTVYPAASGRVALVLNNGQRAAWLIDTASGERLRFFAPPVWDAAWNDEGTKLALIHGAGGSGRRLAELRIEVFDDSGSPSGRPIECEACLNWWDNGLLWVGGKIVTTVFVQGRAGVLIVDPQTGDRRTLQVPGGRSTMWRATKTRDGKRAFVIQLDRTLADPADKRSGMQQATLYRLDVETATLEEGITVPRVERMYSALRSLSPSGRSWLRLPSSSSDPVEIFDLKTHETTTLAARTATWLSGDRLAWVEIEGQEAKLMIGRPGDAREVRSFHSAWLWLAAAPDANKLMVMIRASGDPPQLLRGVYDPEADRWFDLRAPSADPAWENGSVQWAGPGSLAFVGQGVLALQDLARPESFEYVIGSPRS